MIDGGLIISTRTRQVWTADEKRLLSRLSKIFNDHGDRLSLRCGNRTCPDPRITLHRDDTDPGGRILRCGCRDRIFVPKGRRH